MTTRRFWRVRTLLLGLLFLVACSPTITPSPLPATPTPTAPGIATSASERISGAAIFEHVQVLSSPEFGGRKAGTPGDRAAAEYIAQRFAAAGLEPAGDAGSYFQTFGLPFIDLAATPELVVLDQAGTIALNFEHRRDFREVLFGSAGPGHAEANAVFVPDVEAIDRAISGQIILIPEEGSRGAADRARQQGAVGLLMVLDEGQSGSLALRSSYIVGALGDQTIPTFHVSRAVAEEIASAAGTSYRELLRGSQLSELPVLLRLSLELQPIREVVTQNVLGLLRGSDPLLSDQVVIVGGHYDHVGIDPDGTLFPGANDNASGTAVVIAVAEHLHALRIQPARSVLFAAWGAEEAGLVGSQHYVDHPLFPLRDMRAFLNLDVVGRGTGDALVVSTDDRELRSLFSEAADELGFEIHLAPGGGGSDHLSFIDRGVAAAHLIWSGYQGSIHVAADIPERIDPAKLEIAARVTEFALRRLALFELAPAEATGGPRFSLGDKRNRMM